MANTPRLPQPPRQAPVETGPADRPQERAAGASGPSTDGVTYFEGTIVKVDADGNDVLSDHLMPGETLRRETTDRYTAVRATAPDADKNKKTSDEDTDTK